MKAIAAAVTIFTTTSFIMAQNTPQVGDPAPALKLASNQGSVSLSAYKGKWVVLYFYPKDFTSGCTLEAHNFQRDLAKFEQAGAVILGVSVDSADSHKSFCAKEGLNFKLLADTDGKVSESYGSIKDYDGKRMSARNTFIINPEGKIVKTFAGVKPATHSEEVLQALTELQKGS
jgi:peroxiredoxin Q/BCP